MEFPFSNPCILDRLAAFGVPNWSGTEPHNGIDLIVQSGVSSARIISPVEGQVVGVRATENSFSDPVGQLLLTIEIQINFQWSLNLVLEPGTVDPALKAQQEAAIVVVAGQEVTTGDYLADLLAGEQGYTHLHFMLMQGSQAVCAYKYSSVHARYAYENLAQAENSYLPDGLICYGDP
ncbi:MAG: hypothetical protein JRJ59_12580 [Deltaproteobacteria bacterium]|nr:hypothetical protein [Deltaproteobacteria bacterium]